MRECYGLHYSYGYGLFTVELKVEVVGKDFRFSKYAVVSLI